MQNLSDQHSRHAEVVSVLAAPGGFFRGIDHGGGLADNGEVRHFNLLSFRAKRGTCFLPVAANHLAAMPCFSAAIADLIAAYIWLYPVQRHRLLLKAMRTSVSDGSRFSASSDFTVMMNPGVQKPH